MPEHARYPNVLRHVAETPWAIIPDRLAVIVEVLSLRAGGVRLSDGEIADRIGAGPAGKRPYSSGAVAVLPIYGVIEPRADAFTKISGGTSLVGFQQALAQAVNDPQVDAIMLEIDSPGGSTDLVAETAQMVRDARQVKPVWAVANTLAASAAYWIGSQADELSVTPSGEVGSIGVLAAHQDVSVLQEKAGIKTTLVRAGRFKADTNPFEPLSDEAREALQQRVDEFYGMFVRAVARGRGVSVDSVRSGFGEGRVVTASQALAEGMVDRVETFEQALGRLARGPAKGKANASAQDLDGVPEPSFAESARAAHDAVADVLDRARSLAEFGRGRLTASKREALTGILDGLDGLVEARGELAEMLAATDPNRHVEYLASVKAGLERERSELWTTS